SIHIINGSPELVASLKAQGLDSTVTVSENVEEACRKLEIKPELSFDVRVVAPFINSFTKTLQTMAGVKSKKRTAGIQKLGRTFQGNIVGINTVTSPSFNGIIAISFPQETILNLVGKITGAPFTEINSLVQSAVGEILNVTVTGAKKTLNESGYGVRVDLPRVTLDTTVPANVLAGEKGSIVVTFDSNAGPYFIDIRFS
ncbi:MAG: chemotaxis protein CheX, partial [Bdellovibrionota bacterium]